MLSLTNLYNKLRRKKGYNFDKATEEDVRYCYRLFLHREPDEAGWQHFTQLINRNHITIQYLVNSFLSSAEFQKKQADLHEPALVELPHFNMYIRRSDTFIGGAIFRTHTYEPHVTREIETVLRPGMNFVDIGANMGFFTLMAASLVGAAGRVFAFEPNPDNCDLIRKSMTPNGFENIQIFQNAVAEARQTFAFSVDASNGRILHESQINSNQANYTVEAVTLDESLPDLPHLDLIKMDIEGAEPRAWQGMTKTIQKHRPIIIFEFSPAAIRLTSQTEPEDFLASIHELYDLFILHNSGEKSTRAQSQAEIMRWFTEARHHLDIAAYPR